jgi:hypothetical protein
MAAATQADDFIGFANQVSVLSGQLRGILNNIQSLVRENTQTPFGAKWEAFKTRAINPDGTLASADDPNPVITNPISPTTYPAVIRAMSATQLEQALQVLVDFNSLINAGGTFSAGSFRSAQLDAVSQ